MNEEELKIFKLVLKNIDYDEAVIIGSIVGNLENKLMGYQDANSDLIDQLQSEQQAHNDLREKLKGIGNYDELRILRLELGLSDHY